MRICLVVPQIYYQTKSKMPPLGLLYLAAYLRQHGLTDVAVIDNSIHNLDIDKLSQYILSKRPEIVGITTTTANRFEAYELAKLLKEERRDLFIVFGGVHASFCADEILRRLCDVDAVVRGEGEHTLYKLVMAIVKGESFESILGLSFRDGKEVVHNLDSELIEDIDSLPEPARDLIEIKDYNQYLPGTDIPATVVLTSRGCPYACIFCSSATFWRRKVRLRKPENVVSEIQKLIKEYGLGGVQIHDDTFTLDKWRTLKICEGLKELGIKFWAEARVDTLDEEIVCALRSAGCYMLTLGVESGSERILKNIKKGIKIDKVKEVVSLCKRYGIKVKVFFMAGLPGEEFEDILRTQELIFELRNRYSVDESILSICVIYPGTELEKISNSLGYRFSWVDRYDGYRRWILQHNPRVPPFEQPNLPYERLCYFIKIAKLRIYLRHPLVLFKRSLQYRETLRDWLKEYLR